MAKFTPSYDDNVFINCPFDKQYKPIFNPDYVTFVVNWLTEREAKATKKKRIRI